MESAKLGLAPVTASVQKSDPPSRASSESRHISISEPREDKNSATDTASPSGAKLAETPLSMAMRQAGAEAAAKAGQKKGSTPGQKTTATPADTAPVPSVIALSAAAQDPAELTEITAAKTPGQLAAAGVRKSSIEKNASTSEPSSSPSSNLETSEKAPSTEEAKLDLRHQSSQTNTPSRLSEATPVTRSEQIGAQSPSDAILSPVPSAPIPPPTPPGLRQHRGSSISDASKAEIAAVEARNMIKEEDEGEDEEEGKAV